MCHFTNATSIFLFPCSNMRERWASNCLRWQSNSAGFTVSPNACNISCHANSVKNLKYPKIICMQNSLLCQLFVQDEKQYFLNDLFFNYSVWYKVIHFYFILQQSFNGSFFTVYRSFKNSGWIRALSYIYTLVVTYIIYSV